MPSPQVLQSELVACHRASRDGRVFVRELEPAPYVAVGRDFYGRAAIMLDPLPGAVAFRTPSVEFLPTAHLDFDKASVGLTDCTLVLYDETGLGGVLRELIPVLIWGLYDSRVQGGMPAALAYAQVLAMMLRSEANRASPETVQGLWAELLLIAYSSDPELLIDAWHEDPDEIYDFAVANERLEVKSARGAHRRHHFSSSQLPTRAGLDLTVASVLVQRVAGGATLWDLLQRLGARVPLAAEAAAMRKTLAVVPISALAERSYDGVSASASAAFFAGRDVPAVTLPRDVLAASWTADLANARVIRNPSGGLASAVQQISP